MNSRERMTRLSETMDDYEKAIRNHAMAEAAIKAASRELDLATAELEKQEQLIGSRMDDVYEALPYDGEEPQTETKKSPGPPPPPYITEAARLEAIREMERSSVADQENNRG